MFYPSSSAAATLAAGILPQPALRRSETLHGALHQLRDVRVPPEPLDLVLCVVKPSLLAVMRPGSRPHLRHEGSSSRASNFCLVGEPQSLLFGRPTSAAVLLIAVVCF